MGKAPIQPGSNEPSRAPRLGVFDSGVGGLSILHALRERLPMTSMVYAGDIAHSPYGERSTAQVIERGMAITQWLIEQGATMIVIACNTATVVAIEELRARWPALVFIGVEPGIKPAALRSPAKRIAVMATTVTARSDRLRHLITRYAEGVHVHVQPCPGLVSAIENGMFEGAPLFEVLQPHCDRIRAENVDTVVLGCTHYPFVKSSIQELLGTNILLVDTAKAVAERAASFLKGIEPYLFENTPTVRVVSTGAIETMSVLARRMQSLDQASVEHLTIIESCIQPG